MANKLYRIGVVGASSLAGKELADELGESSLAASQVTLLDDDAETDGQLTSAGDEAALIQKIEPESFVHMDFVLFAGNQESTRRYWQNARRAGASIVDMTYALEREKDALVLSPWVTEVIGTAAARVPDLKTPAVIAAHPAAVMLSLVAAKANQSLGLKSIAATVMEPASEYGRAAMDEMHQQTVSLLSFQTLPREQYDAQVSFNLVPTLGENAKIKLAETGLRIRTHYAALTGGELPPLALQLVQAPVFHGYVISALIELESPATLEDVEKALNGQHLDLVDGEEDAPSNLSAAGQEDILLRVTEEAGDADRAQRFWVWMAADNLKLAALNAIACANELRRLRPSGKVQ